MHRRPSSRPSPRAPAWRRVAAVAAFAGACWPLAGHPQAIVPSTLVQAVPGAKAVSIDGTLKGPNLGARDYVVRLEGGRTLRVELDAKSPDTWFAVLDPFGATIHRNQADRRASWSARLPEPGEYRVRVYLGSDAEQSGRAAAYVLRVGIDPGR